MPARFECLQRLKSGFPVGAKAQNQHQRGQGVGNQVWVQRAIRLHQMGEIGDGGELDRLPHFAAGNAAAIHNPAVRDANLASFRLVQRKSYFAASCGNGCGLSQFADFGSQDDRRRYW